MINAYRLFMTPALSRAVPISATSSSSLMVTLISTPGSEAMADEEKISWPKAYPLVTPSYIKSATTAYTISFHDTRIMVPVTLLISLVVSLISHHLALFPLHFHDDRKDHRVPLHLLPQKIA